SFRLHSATVDHDAAVSQDTVNIEQQKPDFCSFLLDPGGDAFHKNLYDAGFNQIVEMDYSDRSPATVRKHEERSDRPLLHYIHRFSREAVGRDGFRIVGHQILSFQAKNVFSLAFQAPPEITVGHDSDERAFGVNDAGNSETLRGNLKKSIFHGRPFVD